MVKCALLAQTKSARGVYKACEDQARARPNIRDQDLRASKRKRAWRARA